MWTSGLCLIATRHFAGTTSFCNSFTHSYVDLRLLLDRVTDEGEACISRMLEALARFKRDSEVQKRVTEQQHRAKLCAAGPQSLC